MKKLVLSIAAAALLFTNANASGIPVVDSASIAQRTVENVKSYTQQIKSYANDILMFKQMVLDTLNFEKHLKELGIDLNEFAEIYGEVMGTIDDMQNFYADLTNLPDDFFKQFERMKNACTYLTKNVDGFQGAVDNAKSLKRSINRCLSIVQSQPVIKRSLAKLERDLQKATDFKEIQRIQQQMKNIENAQAFVVQTANQERIDQILASYDTFYFDKETKNPYTIMAKQKNIQKLIEQTKKGDLSQKETTALTNSILLQMLQTNNQMFEMQIQTAAVMAANQNDRKSFSKQLTEEYLDKETPTYYFPEKNVPVMPKDKYGLPVFTF